MRSKSKRIALRKKKQTNLAVHISEKMISEKIYHIRGQRILLDFDLAFLYDVETRVLKQQVKRNLNRFPADFMFVLNKKEVDWMVSHFVIPSRSYLGGAHPMAFTEQGIAMLSSVLNSERAIDVNIRIMREFVKMRLLISSDKELFRKLQDMEKSIKDHDEQIILISQTIKELLEPTIRRRKPIGFRIPQKN